MQRRCVGSPALTTTQDQGRGTAKGTNTVFGLNGIVTPELVISASDRTEWYRRNPHVRPGVLEALVARGVLVIVPDGMMAGHAPQGVRA